MSAEIHILTGEYPPQVGGVSDYAQQVATGLAADERSVHVWAPSSGGDDAEERSGSLFVHRVCGTFGPGDLRRLEKRLNGFRRPRRMIVQWVPHGYGYRSMNLPLCWWLHRRARAGDLIDVMVHEPFLMFHEGTWKQDVAAGVHRVMIRLVLGAARRVWCAIPEWERLLRPFAPARGLEFHWLPVPSNIPVTGAPEQTAGIRSGRGTIVGHFGTFGRPIAAWLTQAFPLLMQSAPEVHWLLMGRDSDSFRAVLSQRFPEFHDRIRATGVLPAADLSAHLQACDVMMQPYPAGINSRQGSAMACLAHGLPVVSTTGRVTEPIWAESKAVRLGLFEQPESVVAHVAALCADPASRRETGALGASLYRDVFDVRHTISRLAEACES